MYIHVTFIVCRMCRILKSGQPRFSPSMVVLNSKLQSMSGHHMNVGSYLIKRKNPDSVRGGATTSGSLPTSLLKIHQGMCRLHLPGEVRNDSIYYLLCDATISKNNPHLSTQFNHPF